MRYIEMYVSIKAGRKQRKQLCPLSKRVAVRSSRRRSS